jgi:hypothetical protein
MWVFTKYGFYSIACGSLPDGTADSALLMIRATCRGHLRNLQRRFPVLSTSKRVTDSRLDYRHRLIVPKSLSVAILAEIAAEQTWSNFKNEVAVFQGKLGREYSEALHRVWEDAYRLQELSEATSVGRKS